jgi:catechol 2,3-dioxygenase-like lactoylglutathione lyase family enzyme
MLAGAQLVAFVATTNLRRARAFYEGMLGLPVVEETPFACVFDAHGTPLRVTAVEEVEPVLYTVLGWEVADIEAAMAALAARGVAFLRYPGMEQDARGVWRAPSGARVAWFTDPDGHVLSLTQR